MNVQDASGIVGGNIQKTDEIIDSTEQTREFLVNAESWMVELVGDQNEETAKFSAAIAKVAEVQGTVNQLKAQQEDLQGILGSIL